jgi:hypothetical protein
MHIARLPAEAIGFAVPNNGASVLADDNASGFLDHDAVTFAHLAASSAYVVETSRTILSWRWHESVLRLRGGRSRGWGRRLQRRRRNGGRPDWLLWRYRARRLRSVDAGAALIRTLGAWRHRRLRTR